MPDSVADDITMVGGRIVDRLGWDDTRRQGGGPRVSQKQSLLSQSSRAEE
jgi:hypothetical protein